MEQVIQNFIDNLNARIDLINSMEDKLDSTKVDEIERIIDNYGVLDSSRFNKSDLEYILERVGTPISDNYEELDKDIQQFIDEYYTTRSTHIASNEAATGKYNKYIDLLNGSSKDLFVDFDELDEIMSEVGVEIPDRWKIMSYINEKNINNNLDKIAILNLSSKLNTYNKLYLDNKDLNDYINESIKNLNIDIDMIPSLSKKIAGDAYDEDKVKNALSTIILNELYNNLNNAKDEDEIDNLNEMVTNTLNYIDSYEDKIINPIKDIIVNYEDLLNEEVNKGNDINSYVDISVEDIEKLVGDHDRAVDLKRLPLIKSMKDTLKSIDECDKSSDELINYLNLLGDLNKLYAETK